MAARRGEEAKVAKKKSHSFRILDIGISLESRVSSFEFGKREGSEASMTHTVLFLCTGNYYRSRFAEIVFNHLATAAGIDWRADSAGLATELGIFNVGPISKDTIKRARAMGIDCNSFERLPKQCTEEALRNATRVIALKEDEHRQMLENRHPEWPDKVEYWHVHDLDLSTADHALGQIEKLVRGLIAEVSGNGACP
jgi:protein-tyrosine phosphatase